ncbi:beta-ketoacyl synthase N-terminal-like domain-containing protein, partial [Aquimarina sp. RZ0]|uniref:beta-ketoacyl synthase N-terminal-like domain-containing protein n=1 Tax=Aquimarina sp. RZ0 TaxID=2607730 RepID=UPI0012531F5C
MKNKKRTSLKKEYSLNISHLLSSGLSENWLLKELGDLHWEMISKSLDTKTSKIMDSNGERLYASFVRIQWSARESLFYFKENDEIELEGEISLYGNKMFFSEDTITSGNKSISASLMSVFSSRKLGDNEKLEKGKPLNSETAKLKKHKTLPKLAKGFFDAKNFLFSGLSQKNKSVNSHEFFDTTFPIESKTIFSKLYIVDPYDDINGVGLLYYASYPKINDKCERFYFEENNPDCENWATASFCIARDIHYYGNANANEELVYVLEDFKFLDEDKIQLTSSLCRTKDGSLIAKMYTVKQLVGTFRPNLGAIDTTEIHNIKQEFTPLNEKPLEKHSIVTSEKNKELQHVGTRIKTPLKYTRKKLNKIIKDFFNAMFDEININVDTDLRKVGIESIMLTELSEYLNVTYHLSSNPSKFFDCYTIKEITSYLLGEDRSKKDKSLQEVKRRDPHIDSEGIAIIGTSFRVPEANNEEELWKNLISEVSAISTAPSDRWEWPSWVDVDNKHKGVDKGGYVSNIDSFDASFFRISPREAELMDPQQRVLLELTWELFERSGYNPESMKGSKTGVFIGASGSDYEVLLNQRNDHDILSCTGTAMAILTNRISYYFDLQGPSIQLDTACSSSLFAIHEAVKSIKSGECEQAIVGGVHFMCHSSKSLAYHHAGMLSKDGICYTFDQRANGYVRGEGAVLMLLKPLKEARVDGDNILGLIKGTAISHGGFAGGLTVPNSQKQQELIEKAVRNANIDINDISYIEAHGTGTPLGDPIEVDGLTAVFTKKNQGKIGLGSIKSNIGHLEAASGITGLLKILVSFKNKYLPATINFVKLNDKINLKGTPFYIQNKSMPWISKDGKPLKAGVSSFGIGGSNAHLIVEEYLGEVSDVDIDLKIKGPYVFVVSALSVDRLVVQVENFRLYLESLDSVTLSSVAYTLQIGRESMQERLSFIASTKDAVLEKLESYLLGSTSGLYTGNTRDNDSGFLLQDESAKGYVTTAIANKELDNLARLWASGISIDWNLLYDSVVPMKVSLPTYPFSREHYWVGNHAKQKKHSLQKSLKTNVIPKDQDVVFSDIADQSVAKVASSSNATSSIELETLSTFASSESTPLVKEELSSSRPKDHSNAKQEILESLSILLSEAVYLEISKIDQESTFQDLGLDSITGVEFVKLINNCYGLELPATSLYAHPTIASLSEHILSLIPETSAVFSSSESSVSIHDVKQNQSVTPVSTREILPHGLEIGNILDKLQVLLSETIYLEVSTIDQESTFQDLGLDSITGVEFVKLINDCYGLELPATSLYAHPTITNLSEHILSLLPETSAVFSSSESSVSISDIKENPSVIPVSTREVLPHGLEIGSISDKLQVLLSEAVYLEISKIDQESTFQDLGLDSITGVEFIKLINDSYGLELPATSLYTYPTIASFSVYILEKASFLGVSENDLDTKAVIPSVDLELSGSVSDSRLDVNILNQDKVLLDSIDRSASAISGVISSDQEKPLSSLSKKDSKKETGRIAIVGTSGRYPSSSNLEAYWNNLKEGKDCVTEVGKDRWNVEDHYDPDGEVYSKWLGQLSDIDKFDPLFFNISPTEAELMDPQYRIFMEECWKTIEDAGYTRNDLSGFNCGTYVGVMGNEYFDLAIQSENYQSSKSRVMTGNSASIFSARLAYLLNLKGPSIAIDTACSSSLVSIHLACQALLSKEVDMALAGGVTLYLGVTPYKQMCDAGMLSKDGKCKTFDNSADGFVPGEGAGVVLLKRLEDAERDGDHIHGVILGSGINQDGKTNGITAPNADSQRDLIRSVYERYEIDPQTISYIETHGTGTKLGDPIEFEALSSAFEHFTDKKHYCGLGSVKTNIGHTSAASGVAGLHKILLQLKYKQLVPSLHFDEVNKHIQIADSPFYVNTKLQEWKSENPLRASISNFGFSGTNAHLVVEEYQGKVSDVDIDRKVEGPYIFVVSALSVDRLVVQVENFRLYLESQDSVALSSVAYTLQIGRESMQERLSFIASTKDAVLEKLESYLS